MLAENHPFSASAAPDSMPGILLADKVAFLGRGDAYRPPVPEITRRETHMSHVFLSGDQVFKLKKPVRFPYLNFSTLQQRERACRAEVELNRRLAPDVYQTVIPLVRSPAGLAIGGKGEIVDWLVVMKRLDDSQTLDRLAAAGQLRSWQIDRLARTLVQFYRRARPYLTSPASHIGELTRGVAYNRRILFDSRFQLPLGQIQRVNRVLLRFLRERRHLLAERVLARQVIDGHGDLRPEHIWLADKVRVIDCLEFNRRLRMVDPIDELAFLCVECQRLGVSWAGELLRRRMVPALCDRHPVELFVFYRCYRAMLRARLATAHLLESNPRTPQKWLPLAISYLHIADRDAVRLETLLKRPEGRSAHHPSATAEPPRRRAARP
jgi:uncharacterized protein